MTTLEQQTGSVIQPFTVQIPEEALEDLRRRLATTRWPSRELVGDRSQGVQLATMYRVRGTAGQSRLNALPLYEDGGRGKGRICFVAGAAGRAAARAQYAELSDGSRRRVPESHDTDDEGRPLWTVDVIVDDPDADRAEIAGVKIASFEVPEVKLGEEVRFIGFTY